MTQSSLVVVGSGIKFLSHLTADAKIHIEQADKVLYLVNDPFMKEWIQRQNSQAESLDFLYTKYQLRLHCYQAITNYILETLRQRKKVCVVLYGHPTVFSQPGMDAVKQAKAEGYDAMILPGISAADCLFADLMINPLSGYQCFEATDFLIRSRQFDAESHLILWQIDVIGLLGHAEQYDNTQGAQLLLNRLYPHYHPSHEVVLYEAAQYPGFEPRIFRFPLEQLPFTRLSRISTLYIPPIKK